ncbi:auxin response factor 10-like [Hibiscus syriacus]|uniref:auxin response factor 10-like n=1 Tax=Hibiscus syriacus TaxID=106335 RepID=UPI0019221DE5|nr:auxin response factor 10-like [Hibiscus syriacus]
MVQIPPLNSKVYYFPQGHADHSRSPLDFSYSPQIPSLVLCRVASVKFLADTETDQVYAKIILIPLPNHELDVGDDDAVLGGGGFSVPRYCAETIFPRLDYTLDPPVQTLIAKDVRGQTWKFRHIYRGTPRRHLFTSGWSSFVNHKKLVAGDSIVFLRAENGDLCLGIRRAKRGTEIGYCVRSYGGASAFLKEDESKIMGNRGLGFGGNGKVRPEAVLAAVAVSRRQPFEVVYYPRASTLEFCVKASAVKAAMKIPWCRGMRFKMAAETEDSSRISWFKGTVSAVQVVDPIRWPNSPWRLLQVAWDEPDLLQNVKRVSPWLVELTTNTPTLHLSPPRKRLRLPQHLNFPLDGLLMPSSPVSDNAPGIQGARHVQFGLALSDLHHKSKLHSGLFLSNFHQSDPHNRIYNRRTNSHDNESCFLTTGNSNHQEKSDNVKKPQFLLFGQPIFTQQQLFQSCSNVAVSQVMSGNSSLDGNAERRKDCSNGSGSVLVNQSCPEKSTSARFLWHRYNPTAESSPDCKVLLESEDVGRSLQLSVPASYNMFGIERLNMPGHVLYPAAVKQTGDEPPYR